MKLIIAGTRTLSPTSDFILDAGYMLKIGTPTEIVSGKSKGVDAAGEAFAKRQDLPVKEFPADWELYGTKAGPIRNAKMAMYADALLLIWDGSSKGSQSMKNEMKKLNKPVYEIIVKV